MKVKELIELLQKENPENEIHCMVDSDLQTIEYGWMHTKNIVYLSDATYYLSDDGNIYAKCDIRDDEEYTVLQGIWLKVQA
jgi:hypothetical protein